MTNIEYAVTHQEIGQGEQQAFQKIVGGLKLNQHSVSEVMGNHEERDFARYEKDGYILKASRITSTPFKYPRPSHTDIVTLEYEVNETPVKEIFRIHESHEGIKQASYSYDDGTKMTPKEAVFSYERFDHLKNVLKKFTVEPTPKKNLRRIFSGK